MVSFITQEGTHGGTYGGTHGGTHGGICSDTADFTLIFHAPGIHQCQVKADFFKLRMDVPI